MEKTQTDLKELRDKLIGKTITGINTDLIFFDDGSSLSMWVPYEDIEYGFQKGWKKRDNNENKD